MKYDDLPLLPWMIGETVNQKEYTDEEYSLGLRPNPSYIESLRKTMTPEEVVAFGEYCDKYCQDLFNAKDKGFLDIVNAKDNEGRDLLYILTSRWLFDGSLPGSLKERLPIMPSNKKSPVEALIGPFLVILMSLILIVVLLGTSYRIGYHKGQAQERTLINHGK